MIIKNMLLVLSFLVLISTKSFCEVNINFFTLPDSVKAINTVSQLDPYLHSDSYQYRVWGIIKLGLIGTSSDIPRLIEIYNNEPHRNVPSSSDLVPGVKHISIKAIANIGGSDAEYFIESLVEKYMFAQSRDSSLTFCAICDALGILASDNSKEKLQLVYSSKDCSWINRLYALENILVVELKEVKYASLNDSVNYLFYQIKNNFSKNMLDLENFIITKAATSTLYRVNSSDAINILSGKIAAIKNEEELKKYLNRVIEGMNLKLENK